MISSNLLENELIRLRIILILMLGTLLLLVAALWRVQVVQSSAHNERVTQQSVRRVRTPGLRGTVMDRNGAPLAENRASYCLALFVEELRQPGKWDRTVAKVQDVIQRLSRTIDEKPEVTSEEVRTHIRKRLPLPFVVWRNLDQAALARWAESGVSMPGVDVYVEPLRWYPRGALAAHVLGYVGRAAVETDSVDPYHYYLPEMEGKRGIEQVLNAQLAGVSGGRLIRVDAAGFRHDEQGDREPGKGADIRLTLDIEAQRAAEAALDGRTGAVAVVDCRNGDVLALASAPGFDQADLREVAAFKRLAEDEGKPLFDRAVSGVYPPGSTFKPLVALAALEGGFAPETEFECPGYFELGGMHIDCWKKTGHGRLSLRKAIEQSCNTYFCQLGMACGPRRIQKMGEAAGFGRKTGVEVDQEAAGLMPDNAWKTKRLREGWRSGDTCNLSIGQGFMLATPLQMAVFTAALANGGRVFRPRLVMQPWEEGDLVHRLPCAERSLALVRGGMYDVAQAETGTGKRARLEGVAIAAKTGSAEYGPATQRRKYGWMIAYAPFSPPRYAAAIVLEDVTSGGIDAAPRMGRLLGALLGVRTAAEAAAEAAATAAAQTESD